jgi:hypothetical protein
MELPTITAGPDASYGMGREVGTEDQRAQFGVALEEARPGRASDLSIPVGEFGPLRPRELHRMVQQIPGDHLALSIGREFDRNVARCVADRRNEAHAIAQIGVVTHEIGQTGAKHRLDRVAIHVLGLPLLVHPPVLEFTLDIDVASGTKRRFPDTFDESGVPPDVICVQVCVQNLTYCIHVEAGISKSLQPWELLVVPEVKGTGLGVADARVNKNRAARQLDHERLDPQADGAVWRGVAGSQPRVLRDFAG